MVEQGGPVDAGGQPPDTPGTGHSERVTLQGLGELVARLSATTTRSDVLAAVSEHAAVLFEAAGAGVVLPADRDSLAGADPVLVAHGSELEGLADLLTDEDGPAAASWESGRAVLVPDLADPAREWRAFADTALSLGVRAVLCVPSWSTTAPGLLAVVDDVPRPWTQRDVALADLLLGLSAIAATHLEALDGERQTIEQLRAALTSRVVIEQAKGVLAASRGVSVGEAFERMRSHARRHHLTLGEVATAVVDGSLRP